MRAFNPIPSEISAAPSIAVTVPTAIPVTSIPAIKPGIDRVAHHPVGPGVNDLMAFLVRDRVRPETAEMNSRPPGERDPRKDKARQHVDANVAELPERLFPKHLAGQWHEKNGACENG